jgi:hypothetical protein
MITSLIWILACPLGMAAMGGIAWALGRLPGRNARRLANLSSRATCMSMSTGSGPTNAEDSEDASTDEKALARV